MNLREIRIKVRELIGTFASMPPYLVEAKLNEILRDLEHIEEEHEAEIVERIDSA